MLHEGKAWARNTIIFRGLRLLEILNGPDGPRFCSPLLDSPSNIGWLPLLSHSTFVSVCQETLSEQLGENWDFPWDTEPSLYLSFHSVCWPMYVETTIPPWVGAHEAPTGSVTTPLLHGWGLNIHPPVPINLTSPVWGDGDRLFASVHSPGHPRSPPGST